MCGIFGAMVNQSLTPSLSRPLLEILLDGLQRLEYRGYDSAGLALLEGADFFRGRIVGRVATLKKAMETAPAWVNAATLGIAHTRWATHGKVCEANTHPQSDGETILVHNGIIENHTALRAFFPEKAWESQTDTESVVPLISEAVRQGMDFLSAVRASLQKVKGSFAFLILHKKYPHQMIAAKKGNPLSLGKGRSSYQGSFFAASDWAAMEPWVEQTLDLEDNEVALIQQEGKKTSDKDPINCTFYDFSGTPLQKTWKKTQEYSPFSSVNTDYLAEEFTLKEMQEQPAVLSRLIRQNPLLFPTHKRLNFLGCGTSFYACLTAKYWMERWAQIQTQAEISSEFRYRNPVIDENSGYVFVSQSGETLDTLRALEFTEAALGQKLSSPQNCLHVLTNVTHSSMAKKGCPVIPLQAGPELSVISTKAFTAQLAAFARILLAYLDTSETKHLLRNDLQNIPSLMHEVLSHADDFHKAAQILTTASLVLFLGRGELYPIALEGALKLKEISYIFAEGYPAGEMKHGPLALIDEKTVSVVLAPSDELFEKTLSNAQEIVARGGRMVFLTDTAGSTHVPSLKIDHSHVDVVLLPDSGPLSKAFVYAGAVQVLAYKTAKILGKDVDRPRNLAKAVTVE